MHTQIHFYTLVNNTSREPLTEYVLRGIVGLVYVYLYVGRSAHGYM